MGLVIVWHYEGMTGQVLLDTNCLRVSRRVIGGAVNAALNRGRDSSLRFAGTRECNVSSFCLNTSQA